MALQLLSWKSSIFFHAAEQLSPRFKVTIEFTHKWQCITQISITWHYADKHFVVIFTAGEDKDHKKEGINKDLHKWEFKKFYPEKICLNRNTKIVLKPLHGWLTEYN